MQRMLECKECYNDTLQYLQDIHHRFKASRIHMIQYIHHTKQENMHTREHAAQITTKPI